EFVKARVDSVGPKNRERERDQQGGRRGEAGRSGQIARDPGVDATENAPSSGHGFGGGTQVVLPIAGGGGTKAGSPVKAADAVIVADGVNAMVRAGDKSKPDRPPQGDGKNRKVVIVDVFADEVRAAGDSDVCQLFRIPDRLSRLIAKMLIADEILGVLVGDTIAFDGDRGDRIVGGLVGQAGELHAEFVLDELDWFAGRQQSRGFYRYLQTAQRHHFAGPEVDV